MLETVDVCMPTYNGGDVIAETLEDLAVAAEAAAVDVNRLVVVDNESTDDTIDHVRRHANRRDWKAVVRSEPAPLPKAREVAVELVETDWFLFLDDDVRLDGSYLKVLREWTDCGRVGAVQGRKRSRTEHAADWVRRRVRRGGTHATLLRTDAVSGTTIPDGVTVLEDEYLRRAVEARDYRWVLDPMARFSHATQERHPIGWTEGFVGGKYALSQGHTVALNVPFAALTGRNPVPHAKRLAGWMAGRLFRDETANTKTTVSKDESVTTNSGETV